MALHPRKQTSMISKNSARSLATGTGALQGPETLPRDREDGTGASSARFHPYNGTHPKISTRVSIDERRRIDRVLKRRQQSLHEFLHDALLTAESALVHDGVRWRGDVPEVYAWMAMQMCRAKVDEWEQLAAAAKADHEPLDVAAYRKAWGQWQDASAFFEAIVKDYRRRHAMGTSSSPGAPTAVGAVERTTH